MPLHDTGQAAAMLFSMISETPVGSRRVAPRTEIVARNSTPA
jgi:hypothetical protein